MLALAGVGAWRLFKPGVSAPGYARLTASPWAEIVSVQTTAGQKLDVKGQTPLELELPPGEYVVELKNDQGAGKVSFVVKSGEVSPVNCAISGVDVNALVDELVSSY